MKYGRIHELRQTYPITALCRFPGVSESGCHAWRKSKATTDSRHRLLVTVNRLDRQFAVTAPNKALVTGITIN